MVRVCSCSLDHVTLVLPHDCSDNATNCVFCAAVLPHLLLATGISEAQIVIEPWHEKEKEENEEEGEVGKINEYFSFAQLKVSYTGAEKI